MRPLIRFCAAMLTILSLAFPLRSQEAPQRRPDPVLLSAPKEKVLGIGGLFFRAKDPQKLAAWYRDNLGIDLTPTSYDMEPWKQEAGPTIFAPFGEKTEYFGDMKNQWMVNFRVRNLEAIVKQLRANGNEVTVDPELYPNGRFARVHDPEGHPIELWEPAE